MRERSGYVEVPGTSVYSKTMFRPKCVDDAYRWATFRPPVPSHLAVGSATGNISPGNTCVRSSIALDNLGKLAGTQKGFATSARGWTTLRDMKGVLPAGPIPVLRPPHARPLPPHNRQRVGLVIVRHLRN